MVEQLAPIPTLPERNPNFADPGAMPQAPGGGAAPAGPPAQPAQQPTPEAASATPEPSGFKMQPLVDPNDARYGGGGGPEGPTNVVIADIITQGMMPWIMATVDVAVGKADPEDFEDVRQAHQIRINALKEEHPDFVGAAEKAMPFLSGILGGSIGGSKSIVGDIAKGAAAGGTSGFVSGYTEDVGEPTLSGERFGEGAGTALVDSTMGAAGGAVPAGINARQRGTALKEQRRVETDKRNKEYFESRTKEKQRDEQAREEQDAETKKQDAQAKATRQQELTKKYERFKRKPNQKSVHENYAANMSALVKNPEQVFREAASQSPSITDLSRATGLSPVEVTAIMARRLFAEKPVKLTTPAERALYKQIEEVWNSIQVVGAKNFSKVK